MPWGFNDPKHEGLDDKGNPWFQQLWFAGNHADIGGGYPGNESRLPDCALAWMVGEAGKIGLKVDDDALNTHGSCDGMQHDEIEMGFPVVTAVTGRTWRRGPRVIPGPETTLHGSVYARFKCSDVLQYNVYASYRPPGLKTHKALGGFYGAVAAREQAPVGYADPKAPQPTKDQPDYQGATAP